MMIVSGSGIASPAIKNMLAFDRAPRGARRPGIVMAFDRESMRRVDDDQHLHVDATNISKANVCPYLGREIPDYENLGLEPGKIYQLLRDPEELAKAAASFNNKPLLSKHREISAGDHPKELVIGSTGTDASFDEPFLRNSLVVWDAGAIDDIESEKKKELSSAYRYRADMTPGQYRGQAYDGVMRDIVGNHVCLVKEGRAGADVVVGDSMENVSMIKIPMSRKAAVTFGALAVYLAPKMAADEKIDLAPVLKGLTSKNFKDKKAGIAKSIAALTKGKLATDESIEDVVELLEKLEGIKPSEDDLGANAGALPVENLLDTSMDEEDDDPEAVKKRKEFLASKLSAEDMKTYDSMFGAPKPAKDAEVDETPEQKAAREKKEAAEKAAKDALPKPITEKAMDEALKKVALDVRATERGIQEALRKVRPLVGELAMSFDSAEQVNRHVLKMKGIKGHDTMHADALPMALDMLVEKTTKRVEAPRIATDEASAKGFDELFGKGAGEHIRVIG
jgi:hypothetical protein